MGNCRCRQRQHALAVLTHGGFSRPRHLFVVALDVALNAGGTFTRGAATQAVARGRVPANGCSQSAIGGWPTS